MSITNFLREIVLEVYLILFHEIDAVITESKRAKSEMDKIQMMQYLDAESFDYEDYRW